MDFKRDKTYFQSVAVMLGYIIGVGMFSLPYIVSKAGIYVFFGYILFLGATQYLIHLIYANIIVATRDFHRLPGYVWLYLGKRYKNLVFAAKLMGNIGGLLAYIIISGIFLHQLFGACFGGSEFVYASVLFFVEALIVFFGIKMIAKTELFMTTLLLLVIIFIAWKGHGTIDSANYTLFDWKYAFLPYGAMLFALDGGGSLPMVSKMLNKNKQAIKSVVRVATFLAILVIVAFTMIIVGISGDNTTPDALVGVSLLLSGGVIKIALLFGILTMVTSFFGVSESIKETLWWDYKMNKTLSWAIAVFVPYILYVIGFKNLIDVISFVGGVGGGFSAIMLMFVFLKLKKKKKNKLVLFKHTPANMIVYFLIFLFILGMIYEIYNFIK